MEYQAEVGVPNLDVRPKFQHVGPRISEAFTCKAFKGFAFSPIASETVIESYHVNIWRNGIESQISVSIAFADYDPGSVGWLVDEDASFLAVYNVQAR